MSYADVRTDVRPYVGNNSITPACPREKSRADFRLAVIRLAIHLPDEQLVYLLAPLFLPAVLSNVAYIIYHLF